MQQPPNPQWQQPNTQYPPSQFQAPYPQPWQQPPMMPPPPPKRKRNPWLILGIIVGVLVLCGAIGSALGKSSPSTKAPPTTVTQATATHAPTHTSKPAPQWTTTHTFSGHLHNKTALFTVGKGWRLSWSCTHSSVASGATGAVGITAYDQSGHTLSGNSDNPTVATGRCPQQSSPTTGTSAVQQYGGSMELDVYATGDWTVQIEEMK